MEEACHAFRCLQAITEKNVTWAALVNDTISILKCHPLGLFCDHGSAVQGQPPYSTCRETFKRTARKNHHFCSYLCFQTTSQMLPKQNHLASPHQSPEHLHYERLGWRYSQQILLRFSLTIPNSWRKNRSWPNQPSPPRQALAFVLQWLCQNH